MLEPKISISTTYTRRWYYERLECEAVMMVCAVEKKNKFLNISLLYILVFTSLLLNKFIYKL